MERLDGLIESDGNQNGDSSDSYWFIQFLKLQERKKFLEHKSFQKKPKRIVFQCRRRTKAKIFQPNRKEKETRGEEERKQEWRFWIQNY